MPSDLTRLILTWPTLLRSAVLMLFASATFPVQAQQPTQEDLQALRFYLQQDNTLAVQAELERLQRQFFGWSPPDNLSDLVVTTGPDTIDQIFREIAAGAFDQARSLIAQTEADFPDWIPPEDMLELLRISEGQQIFDAAIEAGRAETAIGIARSLPQLISCERVNNAWNLAEMHLTLWDTTRALSIYRAIIETCREGDVLVATLEKADAIATLDDLERLADRARIQSPPDAARLEQVENRLRAGRQVAARVTSSAMTSALTPESDVMVNVTVDGAAAADMPRPPARPSTLGQPVIRSPAPAPTTTATSSASAGAVSSSRLAAVRQAAERGAWADCLSLSAGSAQIEMISQRGWCAYNANRPMEAIDAFRSAAQRGTTPVMRRDAAYGWMLSLLRLNMTEQAAQVLAGVALTDSQRREIEGQILDQRGIRAFQQRDYLRAISFFEAHERLTGSSRRDLALLRGYALLNSGRRAEARTLFRNLNDQLSTPETRRALEAAN